MNIKLDGTGIYPILDWISQSNEELAWYNQFHLDSGFYVVSVESTSVFEEFENHIDYCERRGMPDHDWTVSDYQAWKILKHSYGAWWCKRPGDQYVIYITN